MTKRVLYASASVLVLVGLGLILAGVAGSDWLWQAGMAIVAVAMILSFLTRWAAEARPDE